MAPGKHLGQSRGDLGLDKIEVDLGAALFEGGGDIARRVTLPQTGDGVLRHP
jgi:hypothetical protein